MGVFLSNTVRTKAKGVRVLVPVHSASWSKAHLLEQAKVNLWLTGPFLFLTLKCPSLPGWVTCASSPRHVMGTSPPTFRGAPQALYTSWDSPGGAPQGPVLCSFVAEACVWGRWEPVGLRLSLRCLGIWLLPCSSFAFLGMFYFLVERKRTPFRFLFLSYSQLALTW